MMMSSTAVSADETQQQDKQQPPSSFGDLAVPDQIQDVPRLQDESSTAIAPNTSTDSVMTSSAGGNPLADFQSLGGSQALRRLLLKIVQDGRAKTTRDINAIISIYQGRILVHKKELEALRTWAADCEAGEEMWAIGKKLIAEPSDGQATEELMARFDELELASQGAAASISSFMLERSGEAPHLPVADLHELETQDAQSQETIVMLRALNDKLEARLSSLGDVAAADQTETGTNAGEGVWTPERERKVTEEGWAALSSVIRRQSLLLNSEEAAGVHHAAEAALACLAQTKAEFKEEIEGLTEQDMSGDQAYEAVVATSAAMDKARAQCTEAFAQLIAQAEERLRLLIEVLQTAEAFAAKLAQLPALASDPVM